MQDRQATRKNRFLSSHFLKITMSKNPVFCAACRTYVPPDNHVICMDRSWEKKEKKVWETSISCAKKEKNLYFLKNILKKTGFPEKSFLNVLFQLMQKIKITSSMSICQV